MKKIVVNLGVGPFSLSHKAYMKFLSYGPHEYRCYIKSMSEDKYYIFDIEVDDPRLVEIVEEMKGEANALGSDLKIHRVPDDVYYGLGLSLREKIIIRTSDIDLTFKG